MSAVKNWIELNWKNIAKIFLQGQWFIKNTLNTHLGMAVVCSTPPVSQVPRTFFLHARLEDDHTRVFSNV